MIDSTRIRNLRVAGALAVVAALLTLIYVARAHGSTKAPAVVTAPVLVATRDLPVGTPLSAALASGAIQSKQLPAATVGQTSLAHAGSLGGEVVIQPIFKGEQVTSTRVGPTAAQGLRANLHGALRAIVVPGTGDQLLAPTLKAGDHVDVVANVKRGDAPVARVSLRDLLVLSAPAAAGPAATPGAAGLSATLQLTDKQVQALFWIMKNADWSFVLRPAAKAAVTATGPTGAATVLRGQ